MLSDLTLALYEYRSSWLSLAIKRGIVSLLCNSEIYRTLSKLVVFQEKVTGLKFVGLRHLRNRIRAQYINRHVCKYFLTEELPNDVTVRIVQLFDSIHSNY